jgi:hypothetical protein
VLLPASIVQWPTNVPAGAEVGGGGHVGIAVAVAVAVAVGVAVAVAVAVGVGVPVGPWVGVAVGVPAGSGKPGTQAGPFTARPWLLPPEESPT